jgi:hypothetical protein
MQKISVDKATPGMILKKPVIGGNRMVLLAEGTELNKKWISLLEKMEIDEIWVSGSAEQLVPIEELMAALDERFEPVLNSPYMQKIKEIVRIHIEKTYSR